MIQKFIAYQIREVVEKLASNDDTYIEAKADQKPGYQNDPDFLAEFWGFYGVLPDGTAEHIADRYSYQDAAELYERITGKPAPIAPGDYNRLPA